MSAEHGFNEIIVKFNEIVGEISKTPDGKLYATKYDFSELNIILEIIGCDSIRLFLDASSRAILEEHFGDRFKLAQTHIEFLSKSISLMIGRDKNYEPLLHYLATFLPSIVDTYYLAEIPSLPATRDLSGAQGYLSEIGVDVAWQSKIYGQGVSLCDVEYSFNKNHEDLPKNMLGSTQPAIFVKRSINDRTCYDFDREHGTCVLGILFAPHEIQITRKSLENIGIKGICPYAHAYFSSVTDVKSFIPSIIDIVEAIKMGLSELKEGDVLLIEMQLRSQISSLLDINLPVEVDKEIFNAISAATDLGIIVIEPAGNSDKAGINIDKELLVDDSGAILDSRAIIVGAGVPPGQKEAAHTKCSFSNYGTKLSCHAWGDGIVTTGSLDSPNSNTSYSGTGKLLPFGGTSGASAIIAGITVLIQSALKNNIPQRQTLSPIDMRNLFEGQNQVLPKSGIQLEGNPPYGIMQSGDITNHIGPMPDLKLIFRALGL